MNFLGMGPGELMVILVLALIVFGPQKLPEIGQGLGKAIGEFRRATSQITDEINRELSLDTSKAETPPATSAPAPEPSAPVETSVSGQAQNDGPLVLDIKPPTDSTTFEAAPVNEAPPVEPVETIPEAPDGHAPVDEVVVEAPRPEPNVAARAARARRARKAVESAAEVPQATDEEAAEAVQG